MEFNNSNKQKDIKENNINKITNSAIDSNLPAEAVIAGFPTIEEWESATKEAILSYKDYLSFVEFSKEGIPKDRWLKIKESGFYSYNDWIEAHNEGFTTKREWDDWQELKDSGFVDIDLFYETKNIGFMQTNLRKSFLELLKVAKKSGFDTFLEWKEAKNWNIDNKQDWDLVKEFSIQSIKEFELFKELVEKVENLLNELLPNQEITVDRIFELIDEEYNFDHKKTPNKQIVYKTFSKELFEEILQKGIRYEASNSSRYRFSRLTNIFMRSNSEKQANVQSEPRVFGFQCPNCHNSIPKTSSFCPDCGEKLLKCLICQTILTDATIGTCPHCNTKFHLNHLKEAIKVYGQCPKCKNNLKEFEIV